jgi:hypothetical protein
MYGGEERCTQAFSGDTSGKETTWKDPGVDGRIILKWFFKRLDWVAWIESIRVRIGKVAGSCEYGDEPSGSIKFGEFLKWLRTF